MTNKKTTSSNAPGKAVEEPYDPDAFARRYGVPVGEAKTIIKRYGPSRRKLDSYMAARGA